MTTNHYNKPHRTEAKAKPIIQRDEGLEQQTQRTTSPDMSVLQRVGAPIKSLTPTDVLQLQRLVGNTAVGQLLGRDKPFQRKPFNPILHPIPGIQPKLKVGPANDKYEQEADSMAEHVMRTPSMESKHDVQRDSMEDDELQMKPISTIQRDSMEEDELQMKSISTLQRDGGADGFEVDNKFQNQLKSSGGGSPLPAAIQADFGSKMGVDLSGVRVHTGAKAAKLNTQIQAKAFTHGSDIYMGAGQYNPGSSEGKRLLAHEATHTIQQGAVQAKGNTASTVQRQVIQRAKNEKGKESKADIIDTVLHNGILYDSFYEFTKKEFSTENIECYRDIALYKLKPTRSKAINIYNTYLNGSASPKEINIPRVTAEAVKPEIDKYSKEKGEQSKFNRFGRKFASLFKKVAKRDLFEDVNRDVKVNLSDSYGRFRETKEFKSDLAVLRGSWDPLGYQLD